MKEDYEKIFYNLQEEKNVKFYSWTKQILTIATGFFSVLISFHRVGENENVFLKYSFLSSVLLLGLGILSGYIGLFAEISALHNAQGDVANKINKLRAGQSLSDRKISGVPDMFYAGCRKASFFFLFSSIPCLIWYAFQMEH